MLIREQYVDESQNCLCDDSGLYKPFTDDIGKLFRNLQKEFGRCVSKIYIDVPPLDSKSRAIGWVFEKKRRYCDSKEEYLSSVRVTLHEKEPTVVTTHHYHYL